MSHNIRQFRPGRQQQSAPRIRVDRRGDEFHLRFLADDHIFAELIAEFKFTISPEHRSFDSELKHWVITAAGESELEAFIDSVETQYNVLVYRPGPDPSKAVM